MISEPLSVLAIDDDEGDAELLRRALVGISLFQIDFTHVPSSKEARQLLAARSIDLIFIDHKLGPENGANVTEQLRNAGELRPIIALTGRGDEYVVRELMKKGADDYLAKRDLTPETLRRSIEQARSRFHQRRLESLNKQLTNDLRKQNDILAVKNRKLVEMCDTAHDFVDHVSHEFRTPLTVIKEFASIMRDGLAGAPSEEQCEYLGIIVNRVEDLCILVDDMLDTSKLEAGLLGFNRQDLQFGEVIERLRKPLLQRTMANGATLQFDVPQDLPSVYCDGEKAGRVITNLVINGLKFCGNPGVVELNVRPNFDTNELRVSIKDNGRGIPEKDLSVLFQRFRQLEDGAKSGFKGFGLGLSIARDMTHLNLGDIAAESEFGNGSTFSFTVPFSDRQSLITRYLKRVGHLRNGSTTVSMIEVRCADEHDPAIALEFYIRQTIRRSDLLFRTGPNQWLLVAAGNADDYQSLIGRIEKSIIAQQSSDEGASPQDTTINELGTWNAGYESKEFMKQFLARVSDLQTNDA